MLGGQVTSMVRWHSYLVIPIDIQPFLVPFGNEERWSLSRENQTSAVGSSEQTSDTFKYVVPNEILFTFRTGSKRMETWSSKRTKHSSHQDYMEKADKARRDRLSSGSAAP
ncbi:hypothetical protein NC651_009392 [Populus alba x Populus x berolinensis]|nr:hypothetical protein NC651_009392 [Populus alba x Populus x berolinensis]